MCWARWLGNGSLSTKIFCSLALFSEREWLLRARLHVLSCPPWFAAQSPWVRSAFAAQSPSIWWRMHCKPMETAVRLHGDWTANWKNFKPVEKFLLVGDSTPNALRLTANALRLRVDSKKWKMSNLQWSRNQICQSVRAALKALKWLFDWRYFITLITLWDR